ncbi:Dipeptide transport system permease protein DppB [Roseovarius albus]|uniref:Dipeptide transport system permease protein DppB n=1 Tax=Roseovarius albus TaxID=1247867 RepID=A0A1X7A3P5_9RHOB|nr:ABC transporter permease [Roseovarius albus]SLN69714.1 Dipeptide transport system permease protein DppB [Roseovarius albus]
MLRFILRRAVATTFLLIGVILMTFALARLLPGDPARLIAGARANAEAVAAVRERLGLDDPITTQFVTYVGNVLEGDFGRSVITRRPISEDILTFFPATLELVIVAAFISLVLGVFLGALAAVRSGKPTDIGVRGVAVTGLSVPDFWLALVFQLVFFATLGLLPFGGRLGTGVAPPEFVTGFMTIDSLIAGRFDLLIDALKHMILPVTVLAIPSMAITIRVVRTSMLEVLNQDFIRTARSKGISPARVYRHHALRNALLPIVTIFGLNTGLLISGAVFIELIYDWPGLGRYTANAISASDYNAIMAITLVVAIAYTLINFLVDLSYSFIDPRVNLS